MAELAGGTSVGPQPYIAYTYALSDRKDEAVKILAGLKERDQNATGSSYDLALIYAGLNEKNLAVQSLEKAVAERSGALLLLKVDPLFDGLRSDPRFGDLLRRLGLQS